MCIRDRLTVAARFRPSWWRDCDEKSSARLLQRQWVEKRDRRILFVSGRRVRRCDERLSVLFGFGLSTHLRPMTRRVQRRARRVRRQRQRTRGFHQLRGRFSGSLCGGDRCFGRYVGECARLLALSLALVICALLGSLDRRGKSPRSRSYLRQALVDVRPRLGEWLFVTRMYARRRLDPSRLVKRLILGLKILDSNNSIRQLLLVPILLCCGVVTRRTESDFGNSRSRSKIGGLCSCLGSA